MSDLKLTKDEAIRLITPVVDKEVEKEKRIAFFEYIEKDDEVRLQYESLKRVKKLVSNRYPRIKAPEQLRKRVNDFLSDPNKIFDTSTGELRDAAIDVPPARISDTQSGEYEKRNATSVFNWSWRWASAAVILIGALLFGLYYVYAPESNPNLYVSDHVYNHFTNHQGRLIDPAIITTNLTDAEVQLSRAYNLAVTVPPVKDTEFKGVAYIDIVPGFKTPLLEYYHPADDEYIYIFTLDINSIDRAGKLVRDQNAVRTCIKPKDFHIRDINGKHVVSWKWGDTWYSAISNHNGQTLASLVEPLEYTGTNGQ